MGSYTVVTYLYRYVMNNYHSLRTGALVFFFVLVVVMHITHICVCINCAIHVYILMLYTYMICIFYLVYVYTPHFEHLAIRSMWTQCWTQRIWNRNECKAQKWMKVAKPKDIQKIIFTQQRNQLIRKINNKCYIIHI